MRAVIVSIFLFAMHAHHLSATTIKYSCEKIDGTGAITYSDALQPGISNERYRYLKVESHDKPYSTTIPFPVESNYDDEVTVISALIDITPLRIYYFWLPKITLSETPASFSGRIYSVTYSEKENSFYTTPIPTQGCTAKIVDDSQWDEV